MNWKSYSNLVEDVKLWSEQLPVNISRIIGIPRSGMLPATLLGLLRNIPVYQLGDIQKGFGDYTHRVKVIQEGITLVVDDSVLGGKTMKLAKNTLQEIQNLKFGTMYTTEIGIQHVDYYFQELDTPRIFEWNVFHGKFIQESCCDIDGVLCRDPSNFENDDGVNYKRFVRYVPCRMKPSFKIPYLVTCRLQKWRKHTEWWLDFHGIKYGELIMMNHKTKQQRIKVGNYAGYKAQVYLEKDVSIFIESNYKHAKKIFAITSKPVLCTDRMELFV